MKKKELDLKEISKETAEIVKIAIDLNDDSKLKLIEVNGTYYDITDEDEYHVIKELKSKTFS